MDAEDQPEPGPLWAGATVRWIGPAEERQGISLQPGNEATVVDAGSYELTSFGFLSTDPTIRPTGVLIALASGQTLDVDRQHLILVPPHHPLRADPDGAAAAWVFDALAPHQSDSDSVAAFVPDTFEAVAVVLHPWNRRGQPIPWSEVVRLTGFTTLRQFYANDSHMPEPVEGASPPGEGEMDGVTARILVAVLREETDTPADLTFAVWPGWGDLPPALFPGAAEVRQEIREYFLLRGPIDGFLVPVALAPYDETARAALWWPQDRQWLVATEIDFSWTYVAGSAALVQRLQQTDGLEVVATSFGATAMDLRV